MPAIQKLVKIGTKNTLWGYTVGNKDDADHSSHQGSRKQTACIQWPRRRWGRGILFLIRSVRHRERGRSARVRHLTVTFGPVLSLTGEGPAACLVLDFSLGGKGRSPLASLIASHALWPASLQSRRQRSWFSSNQTP